MEMLRFRRRRREARHMATVVVSAYRRLPGRLRGVMQVRGVLGSVVSDLGCRIVAGHWKPGETLPTEAELMVELNVGRSVVREALRILNAKSLVRSRQMEGTTVLPRAE